MTQNGNGYHDFLATKKFVAPVSGVEVPLDAINPILFPFQRDVVKWAVHKGRCALFLDTGLGKTFCQIEWARILGAKTLIVAPLTVARQTVREAHKIGVDVKYVRKAEDAECGINITNYEVVEEFNPDDFGAVVLDESSILKSLSGKTRAKLVSMFRRVPFRLCCTATPAPNDYTELGNHADFLGVCSMQEMLATFFINANKEHTFIYDGRVITRKGSNRGGQEWRIKHHAEDSFFRWLSSWAMVMTKPSDLGYSDAGFKLPPLSINPVFVKGDMSPRDGDLFFLGLSGLDHRAKVRAKSIPARLEALRSILINCDRQTIVWCGLDEESKSASAMLGDRAVEVVGSQSPDEKTEAFENFQDGKYEVLITKGRIGGFGMNFQNASRMVCFGLSDSWELFYQMIRREWRFGQQSPVDVYLLLSESEREIYDNIMRKEKQAQRLRNRMTALLKDYETMELRGEIMAKADYQENEVKSSDWLAMLGDSCVRMKEIADESVDLSIYSPPFADLFVYSNSDRDLGNCRNWDQFFEHYRFIVEENFRVTKPGRLSCVHTSDIPAMANRDGYIGLRDFPGRVISLHENCSWTFVGRCFVDKNPQAQAIRVKSKSLLFVQLNKDSSHSRPALVDQVLIFKKPGENQKPVTPVKNGELDNERWISWAHGIWTDINETDTLQYYQARDKDDEKHICPLQLETIERCIKLYSNPGETVLTPFMGIGSEAFVAIKLRRKAIGIELKKSYFDIAIANLRSVQPDAPLLRWNDNSEESALP